MQIRLTKISNYKSFKIILFLKNKKLFNPFQIKTFCSHCFIIFAIQNSDFNEAISY